MKKQNIKNLGKEMRKQKQIKKIERKRYTRINVGKQNRKWV